MSARLNFNEKPYISWKGKTINQITSTVQKNPGKIVGNKVTKDVYKKNVYAGTVQLQPNLYRANPLKIYRREIANTVDVSSCYHRPSIKIDEIDRPNGSINNSSVNTNNGLVNTLDDTFPKNTCERPGSCINITLSNGSNYNILSDADNARRRVRSSGMVKRQFDITKNNDTYSTSTAQYLHSRNRTFQQNQYYYIRQGDSTATPGTTNAANNVYSANGINHCQKYFIPENTSFQYTWINNQTYTVNLSGGYYNVADLNNKFQAVMSANFHYYIMSPNNSTIFSGTQAVQLFTYGGISNLLFLLNIGYNSLTNQVELQVYQSSTSRFNGSNSTVPISGGWTTPLTPTLPKFKILNNLFQRAIGFSAASYPTSGTTDQTFLSSFAPGVGPLYIPIYYKPNNPGFAQQGAVSASERVARVKYNSITNSTAVYRNAFGLAVANALAYGVSENGYTVKDKIGYPTIKYPSFLPVKNATQRQCSETSIRG
jgi:hypothetical protein